VSRVTHVLNGSDVSRVTHVLNGSDVSRVTHVLNGSEPASERRGADDGIDSPRACMNGNMDVCA
jgi:hypothetical protein